MLLIVDHYTHKGDAVAYLPAPQEGKALLSAGVPGDTVEANLGRMRRGKCQGWVQEVVEPSSLRVIPRCAHVPLCGGCRFQEMDYQAQLLLKEKWVKELFQTTVSPSTTLHPILGCAEPWQYRNKMEFTFSQDKEGTRYLGLFMWGSRGKVFNLQECHLVSPWFQEAVAATRTWWESTTLRDFYPHKNTGSLRTLTLREGHHTKSQLAILTVSGHPDFALSYKEMQQWAQEMRKLNEDTSCFICIHQAIPKEPTRFYEIHLSGPECLLEELHLPHTTLSLQISPRSFFQPNTKQAEVLYTRALALANVSSQDHVLDLYCGTGTIGMAFASSVAQVTSIEINPYAVLDAQANCDRNNLSNIRFLKGDAGEKLQEVLQENASFDMIILDPPRTGLGLKALQIVLQAQAPRILYIACNPKTQAEEVKILLQNGYTLEALQPVDQFPHTPHIENIALLTKTTSNFSK